jgi:hypothetical protein
MSEYKPNIFKIKIHRLKAWIEDRLTQLLDGLEDEILWGMVYNFLEDAQRRALREGPEVNPTGGLERKDLTEALLGFLGQAKAASFVQELFEKLKQIEMTDEALEIISTARKPEKTLSERVEREVRSSRDRDEMDRDRRGERGRERERHRDRYNDRNDERRYESRRYEGDKSRDETSYYSRSSHRSGRDASRRRDEESYYRRGRDEESYTNRRNHQRSRIPSSNSPPRRADSISPIPVRSLKRETSPGFERTREPSWEKEIIAPAPKAPQAKEEIPSALEAALRERAKRSKNL